MTNFALLNYKELMNNLNSVNIYMTHNNAIFSSIIVLLYVCNGVNLVIILIIHYNLLVINSMKI